MQAREREFIFRDVEDLFAKGYGVIFLNDIYFKMAENMLKFLDISIIQPQYCFTDKIIFCGLYRRLAQLTGHLPASVNNTDWHYGEDKLSRPNNDMEYIYSITMTS